MPKNPVTGKEFLKLCVTCNDRLWTENKVDSLRLRDPSTKFDLYNKQDRNGYSSDDILYFCNEHKIKCFGYDWKMQQFITNKNEPINFNKNIPAFVFIIMIVIYIYSMIQP